MIEAINGIIQDPWPFLINTLFSEFIVVVAGVLFAIFVRNRYIRWRYGGWKVVIKQDGEEHERPITPEKAKEILDSDEELSVYLKGIASSYAWLNCDLITEGRKRGMLVEDRKKKQYIIDMTKNPSKPAPTLTEIHAEMKKLSRMLSTLETSQPLSSDMGEHLA